MSKKDEMPITRKVVDSLLTAVGITVLSGFTLNMILAIVIWIMDGDFNFLVHDSSFNRFMVVIFFVSWVLRFVYLLLEEE